MASNLVRVLVRVALPPDRAFDLFSAGIGRWWREYWNDDRATGIAFEKQAVGGRLLELWGDAGAFEIGRVTTWRPGEEVAFSWRQADWPMGESTEVDVSFRPANGGTEVALEHRGWAGLSDPTAAEGYDSGWEELLSLYAAAAAGEVEPRPSGAL